MNSRNSGVRIEASAEIATSDVICHAVPERVNPVLSTPTSLAAVIAEAVIGLIATAREMNRSSMFIYRRTAPGVRNRNSWHYDAKTARRNDRDV
ncbi:MAG TPA: hypothetical protein VGU61_00880 [Noviherbaspirillum sp.]|uniref:hypothetical protein n=1 Tax=Noviherbaspirillum sp. TaxID=1926288 RepID=UPI002DDD3CBB|nr:hypothetical protein [Noviherbaspirillum sp.]HEV2608791.1 hypothetical protein [Noviherbaspirillum sp.]